MSNFDSFKVEKSKKNVKKIISEAKNKEEMMLKISEYLHDNFQHYNWVGFYIVEGDKSLKLGPYVGEPTVHTKIAFGQGICGQAAEKKDIFIVQDVAKESNYLSCSPNVKSEIVIPIMKKGEVAGELDIDSHFASSFDKSDSEFLSWICEEIVNSENF